MTPPLLQSIHYRVDSAMLFAPFAAEPWSALLDSAWPAARQGRYDIIVADPTTTLSTIGSTTEVAGRERRYQTREDPFTLVAKALGRPVHRSTELPFSGGALGFFGYDLGAGIESLRRSNPVEGGLPDMAIGIYDWALVVDHHKRQSWLVGQGRDARTRARWAQLTERFSRPGPVMGKPSFAVRAAPRSNMSRARYTAAFERIQRYITEGDCYQVNLAQRFTAHVEGDPWHLYRLLRELNPAPYSAYLHHPAGQVLSCSPERFLRVTDGRVETQPIKGTRPRVMTEQQDRANREALAASAKDRAENLMIVDLLRNDLGKNCRNGSIVVPGLFEVESFATVHHLVSTIRGELAPGKGALDLLRGAFPGGSITGAPKRRAMEIIEELEPCRRGVYCGAIGYIGFDGAMDTNIAIRTLTHTRGEVSFSVGGGIVADSDCAAEYRETFDKARAMLTLFGESTAT
ncbi:MAG: aminodeoxychorismate synthase component I [gamma proteobacterium symbiont of Phacoides pectinatus]